MAAVAIKLNPYQGLKHACRGLCRRHLFGCYQIESLSGIETASSFESIT